MDKRTPITYNSIPSDVMLEENSGLWASALAMLSVEDRQRVAFDGQNKLDVPSDLQVLSNAAKDSSVKNRWRFRWPGRGGEDETVVLRDLFSKIVVWIDRFKQVGDIAVQYDPTHAALPWAGVRFLLQVIIRACPQCLSGNNFLDCH